MTAGRLVGVGSFGEPPYPPTRHLLFLFGTKINSTTRFRLVGRLATRAGGLAVVLLLSSAVLNDTLSRSSMAEASTFSEAAQQEHDRSAPSRARSDTIKVELSGIAHPTPKVGFNANWLALPVRDTRLLDSLRTFRPELIRYPGGSVGDHWDWRAGWIDESTLLPDRQVWATFYEKRPQTLEQLKRVVDHVGATPLFSLNLLTSSVEEQMNMLRAAEEIGLPVRYVELGNEYYYGHVKKYTEIFPTAKEYADKAQRLAKRVREEFPEATVAPIGTFSRPELSLRRRKWNEIVKERVSTRDAVAFHPYAYVQEAGKIGQHSDTLEHYGRVPSAAMQNKKKRGLGTFADPIWITEYNVLGGKGNNLRDTWMHSLLAGAYTSLLAQHPQVTVLLAHDISSPSRDSRAIRTAKWGKTYGLTTYGVALRIVFRALHQADAVHPLRFADRLPKRKGMQGKKERALFGNRYDSSMAVIVNMRAGEATLDIQSIVPEGTPSPRVRANMFFSAPLAKRIGDEEVKRRTSRTNGILSVPPFSITHISWGEMSK